MAKARGREQQRHADLALVGGRITSWTGTDHEALAVRDGRIVAVGTDAEIADLSGPNTITASLEGRRVVPGLIDSHVHAVRAGLSWCDEIRWGDLETLSEALETIRSAAAAGPTTGWVSVVGGWHPRQFSEGRGPTRTELDEVAPGVPVYVQQQYEQATLSSAAMRQLGIADGELDELKGAVERDGTTREPTGVIRGQPAFAYCLSSAMPTDFGRQVANTVAMQRELNAYGLTGVIDPGGASRMGPEAYRPLYEVHRRGQMSLRTRLYVHPEGPPTELDEIKTLVRYLHPRSGDDYLGVVGAGEIVLREFYDAAGFTELTLPPASRENLREAMRLLIDAGWPINIHAINDATVSSIFDVWEEINETTKLQPLRPSISHADGISHRNLVRARDLGVGLTVQDRMGMRTSDSAKWWGKEAVAQAPPLRTMTELGITIGGGTDATVAAPINPWRSLWWMVTGQPIDRGIERVADERLDRLAALHAYTRGSAWFSFDEKRVGSIEPGLLADVVVLTADYLSVADDEIPSIRSALTLVGGRATYAGDEYRGLVEQLGSEPQVD